MGPKPLTVRWGAEIARRADRGEAHKRFYPASELSGEIILLLLLCGLYCVLARERGALQYTSAANETEHECFSAFEPPLRYGWASFYMLKGSPTGGNACKGKNVKELRLVHLLAQCIIPNPDGRGQRH